jgi:hypothetical protein
VSFLPPNNKTSKHKVSISLGYDEVSLGNECPTFQDNTVYSVSRQKSGSILKGHNVQMSSLTLGHLKIRPLSSAETTGIEVPSYQRKMETSDAPLQTRNNSNNYVLYLQHIMTNLRLSSM